MPTDSSYALPELSSSPDKYDGAVTAAKLVADSFPAPNGKITSTDYSSGSAGLKKMGLSDFQLVDEKLPTAAGGVENVIEDVWDGARSEVDNHPWRLAGDVAVGAGVGAGLTAAAITAPVWGTAVLATAAIGGTVYTTYEVAKNAPGWISDMTIADHSSAYTPGAVQQATTGLNRLGGDIADNTAGVLGGIEGGAFAGGLVSGLTSSAASDVGSTVDADVGQSFDKSLADKSTLSGSAVIGDNQNPSAFIRQMYGPKGESAAKAYEMARNLLGDNAQGIAGSYARGAARLGQWPVDSYEDALSLDKMPEELPESFVEHMPADAKAIFDLKKQLASIPSDLDIVVSSYGANLPDIAKQIFDATGELVEFCPVKS